MKVVKYIALSLLGVVVLAVAFLTYKLWPRIDEIPEVLPEIGANVDPLDVELPAQGEMPPLKLRDLVGKTAFFVIESRESMGSKEGRALKRKLVTWTLGSDVVGYSIGDAEGFGLMANKIENEFLGPMRPEMPRPIYVDYGGLFMNTFNMPRGHVAFIVMAADGTVASRHSGDADDTKIAEFKELLHAQDPVEPQPAPAFRSGELDNAKCMEEGGCLLVFLDEEIKRPMIPGMKEANFGWDMKAAFQALARPSVRLLTIVNGIEEGGRQGTPALGLPGVVVGKTDAAEVHQWTRVDEDLELRKTFGVPEGTAALVGIDAQGRLAFSEQGRIPLWRLGLLEHFMGIDEQDEDDASEAKG